MSIRRAGRVLGPVVRRITTWCFRVLIIQVSSTRILYSIAAWGCHYQIDQSILWRLFSVYVGEYNTLYTPRFTAIFSRIRSRLAYLIAQLNAIDIITLCSGKSIALGRMNSVRSVGDLCRYTSWACEPSACSVEKTLLYIYITTHIQRFTALLTCVCLFVRIADSN